MSRTGIDASTLARSLRMMAGDGSMEWVMEPIQARVLLDVADALDENAELRERITTQKQTIQAYRDESREWREVAERAQAENSELRERLRVTESAYDVVSASCRQKRERINDLEDTLAKHGLPTGGRAENAELRELVLDLYCLAFPRTMEWEVADETYDKYSPCELCEKAHGGKSPCASTSRDMSDECCTPFQADIVAERMRELGIEVDE